MFSKIKNLGKKIATKVYTTLNPVVKGVSDTLSKAGKQPAAVGMAFPVAPGTSLTAGQKTRQARDQAVVPNRPGQNPIRMGPTVITVPRGFSPSKGGLVKDKPPAGTPAPTNIYNSRSGGSSSAGNSVVNFAPVSAPSTLTSSVLSGTSGGSSGGSINLPSSGGSLAGGAIGALAGIKAAQKTAQEQSDKYDPMTGELLSDKKDKSEDFFKQYLDQLEKNQEPDSEALYAKAERESGIREAQQNVNNYQAQLNSITAQAEADQLAVTGQGRGIPEPIILGQQSQIAKEAAIRALPIAAQLSAAQGNLELAQQHLDTRFKLMSQDAQNKYEHKNKVLESVYSFSTAQEKKRLDQLAAENKQQYSEHQDFLDAQDSALKSAYQQNAPNAIKNAIANATTTQEVYAAAGQYLGTIPKATGGVGGGAGSGASEAPLTASQKTAQDQVNTVLKSLESYKQLYSAKTSSLFRGINLTGTDAAELRAAYNALMFQIAQAAGTGALQAADREIVEGMLPNPTSIGGALGGAFRGGKEGGLAGIEQVRVLMTNKLNTIGGGTGSSGTSGENPLGI